MKYKVLKNFISKKGSEFKVGDEYSVERLGDFVNALIRNGYIEQVSEEFKISGQYIPKFKERVYYPSFDSMSKKIDTETSMCLAYSLFANAYAELGLSFETYDECQKWIEWQKAKQVLLRDKKGFRPDWHSDFYDKWEVCYEYRHEDMRRGELFANSCNHCTSHHDLWFKTKEDAQASIKAHPNEWKVYLGVEE